MAPQRQNRRSKGPVAALCLLGALLLVSGLGLHLSRGPALASPILKNTPLPLPTPTPAAAETAPAAEETTEETPWNLLLVNPWNPLPDGFAVELAEAPGGELVDARILAPLQDLLDDAEAAGVGPIVVSGFRTPEKQQSLLEEKAQEYLEQGLSEEEAEESALGWVARPGFSEHQTGLAVDINGAVWEIYPWLAEHCWDYGFILRYPEGKTEITGIQPERWHVRYVGPEAAQAMRESGQCLEEYLAAQA